MATIQDIGPLEFGDTSLVKIEANFQSLNSSKAEQSSVDLKQDLSEKGVANGYAGLDSGGKVPTSQLPTTGGIGDLISTNNLSDLQSPEISRDNLGVTALLADKQNILAEGAFIDGDKTKLDSIEAGAEVNTVDSVNGRTGTVAGLAEDNTVVKLTGDQEIADVKTFTSSPIVPTPTTDLQVATKKYVDDNAGGGAVDSVNGQTGIVVLDADDISDITTTNKFTSQSEIDKLAGIETNAEVNNISDANATDLTDGGASTLHYHDSDRARANHTGTQNINTITGLTDYDLGTTGGAITINWDNGLNQEIILNANTTFTFSNPRDGFVHEILLTQDSTVRTVTFPTITWQDGTAPDLSVPSGKYLIQLSYRGAVYYGAVISFNA